MSSDGKIHVPRTEKNSGRLSKRKRISSAFSLALTHMDDIFQYFVLQVLLKTDFYGNKRVTICL